MKVIIMLNFIKYKHTKTVSFSENLEEVQFFISLTKNTANIFYCLRSAGIDFNFRKRIRIYIATCTHIMICVC